MVKICNFFDIPFVLDAPVEDDSVRTAYTLVQSYAVICAALSTQYQHMTELW